jgi:hypothetical protein
MLVPLETLARQDAGYRLTLDSAMFERHGADGRVSGAPIVLPVTQEALEVHTTVERVNREGDETNPCT